MSHRPSALLLALAALLALGMAWHYYDYFLPQVTARQHIPTDVRQAPYLGIDLYQCWIAGRELFHSRTSPYSEMVTRKTQAELYGRSIVRGRVGDPLDEHRFPYPLYTVVLLAPATVLPFEAVRLVAIPLWIGFSIGMFLLWVDTIVPGVQRTWVPIGMLLFLTSYPVLEALFAEQLAIPVALFLAGTLVVIRRNDLRFAGVLLAVSTIKPQLVLLPALYLVFWTFAEWKKRKNLMYGALAAMVLLIVASEILLPNWFLQWLETVRAYRTYTIPPLAQYLLGSWAGLFLSAALIVAAVAVAWKFRDVSAASLEFSYVVATLLTVTIIVFPSGDAVYDHILLLPAILVLTRSVPSSLTVNSVSRALTYLAVASVLWPYISSTAIVIFGFIDPVSAHREFFNLLPLRTAAPLPFELAALLGLRMRSMAAIR